MSFYSCVYIVLPQIHDVNANEKLSDGFPALTVSWTAVPGSGITYTVWYSTSSGSTTEPPSGASTVTGITGTSTTLNELEQGTRYFIWVAANSSDGQGSYSTRVSQTTFSGIIYSILAYLIYICTCKCSSISILLHIIHFT